MDQTQTQEGPGSAVRSLLIPLESMNLLVPNTAVAEVALLGRPEPIEGEAWLLGAMDWRGLRIPLVSFECFSGAAVVEADRNSRAIVFNTLNGNAALPFVAVLSQGIPRLVLVDGSVLHAKEGGESRPGVLCQAELHGDDVVIPDLDALEQQLLQKGFTTK